jgi:HEAT repeat protein
MKYCYDIFSSERDVEARRTAVELLRVVGDKRALGWVAEFLADEDATIQSWGIGVLDQLTFSGLIEAEDAESLLAGAETHPNIRVREQAARIRERMSRAGRGDAERQQIPDRKIFER